jgi:hypothetical protein
MATHNPTPEDPKELEQAIHQGYEHREINYPKVGKMTSVGTIGLVVVSLLITWGTFMAYDRIVQKSPNPALRENAMARTSLPPSPLLQSNVTAKADIAILRRQEEEHLQTSKPIAGKPGYVSIPIEVAIDKLAETGLPTQAPSSTNP